MNTNGRTRVEQPNVATSFSELTHDAIELAELQAQLLALDLKETSESTKVSLTLGVVGTCLLLGSIPVALIALAELLIEQLDWSRAAGFWRGNFGGHSGECWSAGNRLGAFSERAGHHETVARRIESQHRVDKVEFKEPF